MSLQAYNSATDTLTPIAENDYKDSLEKVSALPTASADLLNKCYLLTANQNTYIKGGIYQCQSDGSSGYTWILINGSGVPVDVVEDGNMNAVTSNAVFDKFDTLGTASEKDATSLVRPDNHDLVESGSVYNAIQNAISSIYVPHGDITCAELVSSLLVDANIGNVYTVTDSGTTTALFIQGAGKPISAGNAVGIVKAGQTDILFNLMGNMFDLSDYQTKELPSGALIEDIVPTDASASNKLVTVSGLNTKTNGVPYVTGENYSSTDLNEYLTPCITFINVSSYTNVPSNTSSVAYMLEVKATGNKGSTDLPYVSQILTAYDKSEKFIRSRNPNSGTWSSWQKLVTESDLNSKGVFKGFIEPNKKLTINMDAYSEVYGYVQVMGSASTPFRLHNAARNASPSVFLKKSVTIDGDTVQVEKSFGTTASIGSVTITNTNGVWTITNTSNETESYWVGGYINSVSLSDI